MKTSPLQSNNQPLARHNEREQQTARTFPLTDCRYQTAIADVKSAAAADAHRCALRNFRILSRDFMAGETRRDYVAEASLFAFVTAIVAWPLFSLLVLIAQVARG